MNRTIFIIADHGLAIVYFLQSAVVPTLIEAGFNVVVLTDDAILDRIEQRFRMDSLQFEGLRLEQLKQYYGFSNQSIQWWLDFLRRAGASSKINLQAVDSYVNQVESEAHSRRKIIFPLMRAAVSALRRSKILRSALTPLQSKFQPGAYSDLFEKYDPELVIASTPGWRWDRYLLREAGARNVATASVIVGWDNTSSYSLPGADVDWVNCWSEIQKQELIDGSDWQGRDVEIGGIPSYDGYFSKEWLIPREEYFQQHNLDPEKKLISYACSFTSFSPNIQNVKALIDLISDDAIIHPVQLLIRFHPNHYLDVPHFIKERNQMTELAHNLEWVNIVEPIPIGGSLGYFSGEDVSEKSSMMAHSDVFTTVYSTMVVEASIFNTPVVSICIDSPQGWPGKYTLPLSLIGGWPTHSRFRESCAGRETQNRAQLRQALNYYLDNPRAESKERQAFIQRECTFTDSSAGRVTAGNILRRLVNE
jgi:hypothetical protein